MASLLRGSDSISNAAHRFCHDFARKASIEVLLGHFSRSRPCEALEHGMPLSPELTPFLGRPFVGIDGVRRYFATLAQFITYDDVRFSDYIVDQHARKVSVKGAATFTWTATRQSWRETFTYLLDFDDQDKITRYQVWGDTGALNLASQGSLDYVSRDSSIAGQDIPPIVGCDPP